MEERFRGKTLWIALAALAILGMCALLFFGAVMMFAMRPGTVVQAVPQVAPQTSEESSSIPPATYYNRGMWQMGRHGAFGIFRPLAAAAKCLGGLLFFGLILAVMAGVLRRHCWGRWMGAGPDSGEGHGWRQPGEWHGWHYHGPCPPRPAAEEPDATEQPAAE